MTEFDSTEVNRGETDGHEQALARFFHEIGHLKRTPRTGWLLAGIAHPESVSEHSHRVSVIGAILAMACGADAGKTALMCLLHDIPETRTGDIPSVGKKYVSKSSDITVLAQQLEGVADPLARQLLDLAEEYVKRETLESKLAHDADKIECLAQAMEYTDQGHVLAKDWIESSRLDVETEVGARTANAMASGNPGSWWQSFVRSYRSRIRPID
ncbi:HD domain-containing protein [Pseudonocardia charpentierae]|uniref:5'-deoxynucleotidase n=1 Tax=Pseudonocardia charpentierae TaxID=3075545 RepID=A0ABU2NBL2_9PSEU|nr:HD domain-containing protein [Pseudonocardia sp. DSM 45834]MDT0351115.1 HD domain-containing protein [Pseudonocardia sp. DSM 45834]